MKLPQIKGRFTWPDFPKQDWKLWEARKFSRPPDGATIDTSYMDTRPCCIHCATWICAGCWDWRRSRATRAVSQFCGRCGSTEGFFSAVRHYHDHMALPMVPFLVPVINDERASIVRQLEEALGDSLKARAAADRVFSTACPAGDPCPATGCPACCPTYDPCSSSRRRDCNPGGEMHVPEEAEAMEKLKVDPMRERKCVHSCIEDGERYPECPVHGETTEDDQGAPNEVLDEASDTPVADAALAAGFPVSQGDEILPHVVKTVTDIIREAYAQGAQGGDKVLVTVLEAQELCNLAVQTQYSQSNIVEAALKKVLADAKKREVTDKDRELIAKNAKATIERRDRERAEKLLRETAMHHAVEIHKAGLSAGHIPTKSLTEAADDILKWLTTTAE